MTAARKKSAPPPAAPSRPAVTDEQRRALEARDVSVALSAGAGCGKTFVLTQRFLAHFDPHDPDALRPDQIGRLVAITFTNAAAREMRDRVRRACYERLLNCADEDADHWSAMIRSLDAARISTIDSFCSTLLRTHAVEAGLDPRFTPLDAAQSGSLLAELTDDVLRELLSAHDGATLDLVEQFSLEPLAEMLQLLAAHRDADDLARWLAESPAGQVKLWAEFHREQVVPSVMRRVVESEPAQQLREFLSDCVPVEASVAAQRATILAILSAWQGGETHGAGAAEDLAELRENAKIIKRSPKTWPTPGDYDTFRDRSKELRDKVIDKRSRDLAFDAAAALPAAEAGLAVLGLAARVLDRYTRSKQEAAALDFRDLLSRARALLRSPEHVAVRRRLAEQIHLLLVDEFQDTDQMQVDLIETLCGGALERGKLFFVGDHKQSIYRFRGADPQVFHRLRKRIPDAGKLPLTLNFRSQPAILNFVNALFDGELGTDNEPLQAHHRQVAREPSVEFLWALPDAAAGGAPATAETNGAPHGEDAPAGADETGPEGRETFRRREADWIARRLRSLIDSQQPIAWDSAAPPDAPRARAVRPGDVAILFRALSDVWLYEDALRKYGLDYYLVGGHAFYSQQEIFDVANLLRAVAYPDDAVSLAGVLRSPFFCLTDEALFWLGRQPGGLPAGLFADRLPEELGGEERPRVEFAADTLRALRRKKDSSTIVELVQEALSRTGYDALLLAEFLGERKLANLRKLIDQARSFERGGMFHLSDFIVELSGRVAEQPKEALAATSAADTDVIRLMSIHQAKGLEFPVVVVADLDRMVQSRSAAAEFSRTLGPLVRMPARGRSSAVGGYELFNSLAAEEDLAEVQRLLYVAATRAADHLILSAGLPALDKLRGPWMRLVERKFDLATGAYRGPALPSECRPRVNVIREQPDCRPVAGGAERVRWEQVVQQATESAAAGPGSEYRLIDAVPAALSERQEFSFSRLSGRMHARRRAPDVIGADDAAGDVEPQSEAIDPLGLGTLVHAILAEIRCGEAADVASLVRRHADAHVGSSGEERRLAQELIERFLKSDRARRLAAAKTDHAELEFLLAWGEGSRDAPLRLTGFIDRLYEDAGGHWHIVDFKTNRVDSETLSSVAAGYELQMLVYALAVEQVLGRPPQSLTLHMLRTGDEYQFTWNDAARRRVRRLVDEAIGCYREASRG